VAAAEGKDTWHFIQGSPMLAQVYPNFPRGCARQQRGSDDGGSSVCLLLGR